jgi:Protein of unknown function (DUF3788)
MGRSSAYFAGNRYSDPEREPQATAPLEDLPPAIAARFRALRSGLLALDGIAETVRFMGNTWRWAWEYGIGNRKLCWLHIVGDELSATFTLSDNEEDRVQRGTRLASMLGRAIEEGQRTGPVKWCWVELSDRRAVEAFIRLAARKATWLSERGGPHRAPRLGNRRSTASDDELDTE